MRRTLASHGLLHTLKRSTSYVRDASRSTLKTFNRCHYIIYTTNCILCVTGGFFLNPDCTLSTLFLLVLLPLACVFRPFNILGLLQKSAFFLFLYFFNLTICNNNPYLKYDYAHYHVYILKIEISNR